MRRAGEPTGDLAPLVEAHRRWLGGRAALTQLQDLTWTGTFKESGFAGRKVLRETRTGWRREEVEGVPNFARSRIHVDFAEQGIWALLPTGVKKLEPDPAREDLPAFHRGR